jgi:5-methylcytosine-specific restriction endonuclease McrA
VTAPDEPSAEHVIHFNGMRLVARAVELDEPTLRAFRIQEKRQQREAERQHRLRTNGPRDKYTLEQIGDRDGWRCWICGDQVDRAVRAPDSESRSVDHVVPVSRGGTDTLDNIKLAHLGCNLDRHVSTRPAYNQAMRAARLRRRSSAPAGARPTG